ncbi:MAG: ABC transporter ATP-binding protein [Phycisphaerae bacterium]|jgi:iron complex transport system ATP-binding protein|nr:ABC transporter ATP-binding protein [Phycisphaerae bacterium]
MAVIDLVGIRFVRGEHTLLSDVSWTIDPGQHWALLGANGSGKTTLLKIITGYEWPSDGLVYVLGEKFGECNLPELRKTIGWVSSVLQQDIPERDSALSIVVSGLEASLGLYREFSEEEFRRGRRILESVGGGSIADRKFQTLSQGERQRVLIARAMINNPKVLILDEPCSGLDPASRENFLNDLARLTRCSDAPAIVLVTHHIEEIQPWINHVMVIKNGRSLASGETSKILTDTILSRTFECPCRVDRINNRYFLRLTDDAVSD